MKLRIGTYVVVPILGCMLASATLASAQSGMAPGNKEVYNSSTHYEGSSAYVDATAFQSGTTVNDFCQIVNEALVQLNTQTSGTGGVVDARGLKLVGTGTGLYCALNSTPWVQSNGTGGYTFATVPADILMPAMQVCIVTPWVIPNSSRLVGDGPFGAYGILITAYNGSTGQPSACKGNGSNIPGLGTAVFSDPNTTSSGYPAMIYMGFSSPPLPLVKTGTNYPSAPCPTVNSINYCSGVAVKDVQISAQPIPASSGLNVISNANSSTLSTVDQLELFAVTGTGLISNTATYTGSSTPDETATFYTNLSASMGSTPVATSQCLSFPAPSVAYHAAGVAGIHGLTCVGYVISTSSDTVPNDGLAVNTYSNSIEDTHFETVEDGIQIGASSSAQAVVVINTQASGSGAGEGANTYTFNTVHLEKNTAGNPDVVLLATNNACNGCDESGTATLPNTIQDDNTGATLGYNLSPLNNDKDDSVGLYAVGEGFPNYGQYTRINTSPSFQTWGFNNTLPVTSALGTVACSPGSIYSDTAYHAGTHTIWVCQKGTTLGTYVWTALK